MTWPTEATKQHFDQATDDAKQARTEIAENWDRFNQLRNHVSTFWRDVLEAANAAAARSSLGLVIGTHVLAPNGNGSQLHLADNPSISLGRGSIDGYVTSRASATSIDVAPGAARDDTDVANIVGSPGTINLATMGANGLDTGSLANNTWYHVFAIAKAGGADPAFLASTSADSPTMPTDYTVKRRIGSFRTDGSAEVIAFTQYRDEFLWDVPRSDVDETAPGTASELKSMSVPTGVKVWVTVSWLLLDTATRRRLLVLSPDQADTTPTAALHDMELGSSGGRENTRLTTRTNTSAQIRRRLDSAGAGTTVRAITLGWIDPRGKDS